jgi:hypothetical protein
MSGPGEHERLVKLLKAARRPEGENTAETLEENLRWLVREAMPRDRASDALRQRVQALTAAQRGPRRAWPARLADFLVLHRAPLIGVASATVFVIIISLLLTNPAPADVLGRTLAAIDRVTSAHCTGWYVSYRREAIMAGQDKSRFNVEWWYKAPDRYRKDIRSVASDAIVPPCRLLVTGRQRVFLGASVAAPVRRPDVTDEQLTEYLSPLDFFVSEGVIRRAYREHGAEIVDHGITDGARRVQTVDLRVDRQDGSRRLRQSWVLTIDPTSNLILRSSSKLDWFRSNAWVPLESETLDVFDYNVDLRDALFRDEIFGQPLQPAGRHR